MDAMNDLSASLQDYLEAILFIETQKGIARVADLAQSMNVTMPSVVKSLTRLKEAGLIAQEPYQDIQLTSRGRAAAKKISHRHAVLKKFFMTVLDIDEQTAEEDACRIEHVISAKAFERLTVFVNDRRRLCRA